MFGLSIKEVIFGGVTVVNTGLGITNVVLNCKNRKDIKDLRKEVNQFAVKTATAPAPAPAPAANLAEAKEVVDKLSAVVEGAKELMANANAATNAVTPEVVEPEVIEPEVIEPEINEEKKPNKDQKPKDKK